MPKRFQKGSVKKIRRPAGWMWVGQWWEDGHRRNRVLGLVSEMCKTQAQSDLAEILRPINAAKTPVTARSPFGDFVRDVVFPFCRRKWKASTRGTTEDRIRFHLIESFEKRLIGGFERDELQNLLDMKAESGLSFSAPLNEPPQQALIMQSGLGFGSRMLIAKDPRFDGMDVRTRYVLAGPVKQNGIEISRSH